MTPAFETSASNGKPAAAEFKREIKHAEVATA
jgi:hypothetical protein